jgi:hypothetical protein
MTPPLAKPAAGCKGRLQGEFGHGFRRLRTVADTLAVWGGWASDLRGQALDCGHFLPEEKPAETLAALRGFHAEGF